VTRKGLLAWGSAILFVAAWMFLLGVLVGRGTAPIEFDIDSFQRGLLAKREAAGKEQEDQLNRQTGGGADQTDLEFYSLLKSSESDDQLSAPPAAKAPAPAPAEKAPKPTAAPLRAAETAKKPPPATPSKTDRLAASPVPEKAPKGPFTVQVASLKEARAAEAMVARLAKKGYPAHAARIVISGKPWYRVQIGGLATRTEADRVVARLKKEKLSPIVVQR
jgi:cell division protein FtsN